MVAATTRLDQLVVGIKDASSAEQIHALKTFREELSTQLQTYYERDMPIRELVSCKAVRVDQLLASLWQAQDMDPALALVAVGGYGRGELHPHSDIDLMILCPGGRADAREQKIRGFLTLLWDIGLEVGHSVRTVAECQREARRDITIATNLMESRILLGNRTSYQDMMEQVGPKKIWPNRRFFAAKRDEQEQRHEKFAGTSHNVEPHIKEGPGGLRDIQTIGWVAKRYFGVERLHELVAKEFLTLEEYEVLKRGRELLWRIRYGLHLLSGRREDRLLFGYQKAIAKQFGYRGQGNRGVESFMKDYYNTVREMSRLNEILLQHFEEEIIFARRKEKIVPLNKRFQIRHDVIEVTNERIFARYPFALLEMFLLIQQNPAVKGVRASTIRLARKHAEYIDDDFRKDIRARSYFLEIIRQPRHVGHELRRMHRYRVLAAYLPVFARIQGLMQFDLFHSYTVDEHVLFVVRNMRLFGLPESQQQFPQCWEVMKKIPKQEVLYIAGLFHDIAKGRGGDHSELGARDATRFCVAHGLSDYDTRMVAWLVRYHLLMSKTAQRADISDPEVIADFARQVADQNHLNHLYLLTVADIRATNPNLWNSWRASLLNDLYHHTLLVMRRGMEKPLFKLKRAEENRAVALSMITDASEREVQIKQFWKTLHLDYFLRHSADEIAWHAEGVVGCARGDLPRVLVDHDTDKGWSQIFIYARDEVNVFATTTRMIEQLQLNILDARIITSKTGYTLKTYVVLEQDTKPIRNLKRAQEVIRHIRDGMLGQRNHSPPEAFRQQDRQLKSFRIPTRVEFSRDEKNARMIMEVTTLDRPGVLSRIGYAMAQCGFRLQGAKVATYGERVEDIFFIARQDRSEPDEVSDCADLRESIISALD